MVEGIPAILGVLDIVRPYIGAVKNEQARAAIAAYSAQPRVRGDRTQCKRGHPYGRRSTRNGRSHAVCNACQRLMERKKRASVGIALRQFKNIDRRYTEWDFVSTGCGLVRFKAPLWGSGDFRGFKSHHPDSQ